MTFAKELERTASKRGLELCNSYEFRFRRRYNLPPTDPRFLEATIEDIVIDYWAHAHLDDPKLREQDETDDFEAMLQAVEQSLEDDGQQPIVLEPEVIRRLAEARGQIPPEPAKPEAPLPPDSDFEEVFSERYG
jgi:hypothetical protein